MVTSALRCPNCSHEIATLDLPTVGLVSPDNALPTSDAPLLLRMADAARLLSVSRTSMYALVASGHVRSIRVGRSRRVARAEIERFAAGIE